MRNCKNCCYAASFCSAGRTHWHCQYGDRSVPIPHPSLMGGHRCKCYLPVTRNYPKFTYPEPYTEPANVTRDASKEPSNE